MPASRHSHRRVTEVRVNSLPLGHHVAVRLLEGVATVVLTGPNPSDVPVRAHGATLVVGGGKNTAIITEGGYLGVIPDES